jgi:hypothetical protein
MKTEKTKEVSPTTFPPHHISETLKNERDKASNRPTPTVFWIACRENDTNTSRR